MKTIPLFLLLLLLAPAAEAAAQDNPGTFARPAAPAETKVHLQFPNNPVSDVANFYEMVTRKRLIRDSNLAGANLTIMVPEELTAREAAAMIESVLLLNGYTLVPVDEKTSKLLGPTKQPKSESIPLYASETELPATDQVVSFFMPFNFLNSDEASKIFSSYIALRPYGSLVAVPNVNALIITENVPLIKRLVALKRLIDVPGAKSATEFFTLQRADAQKVADLLKDVLEKKKDDSGASSPRAGNPPAAPPAGGEAAMESAPAAVIARVEVKVAADTRTNRVMVIAPEQEMPYIRELISSLDVGVPFEEPLERPLRFVSAGDVLPVLANLLTDGNGQSPANGQPPEAAPAPAASAVVENNYSPSSGNGANETGGKPDKLRDPAQNTAPLSMVVGNARIIADRSSNKIIVMGPPESRSKAARVLDMLDQRPKQIYLATVIGQLTLGDGIDAGIKYPGSITGQFYVAGSNGNGGVVATGSNSGVNPLPDTQQLVNSAINLAAGAFSGLSIYGVIADSIDVTVSALQSTNKFKVISRPVVYTANNKRAVISSGQEVPIPESSLTSSLAVGAQGTSIASNIGYKPVVLKLEVIPLINSKNEVTLTIAQQNDNVQENVTISDNQVPVIGTQELTTTVTVPNRHTIVLGGLITEEERETKSGLPFLANIPGLSYLFGSTQKNVVRRELIIMIQPFIIEDGKQLAEANYIEKSNVTFDPEELYEGNVPVRRAELPGAPVAPKPKPAKVMPTWQEIP